MKKYPYVFLGIFISILVLFIVHIISIHIKINQTINFKDMQNIHEKLMEKKKDIETIKNEQCKSNLKDMLDRIDVTIPEKGMTLKEYYKRYYGYDNNRDDDDGMTFLYFYSEATENCNIDNESIYLKALESLQFPYEIKNRYLGSYQIGINDIFVLKEDIDRVDELGSYSSKMLEVETLNKLIEEVKKNEKSL